MKPTAPRRRFVWSIRAADEAIGEDVETAIDLAMAETRKMGYGLLAPGLVVAGLVIASCSSLSDQSDEVSAQSTTSVSAVFDDADSGPATTQSAEITDLSSSITPFQPYDENPPTTVDGVSNDAYISRLAMSATSIELVFAHQTAAELQVHRIPRTSDEVTPDPAVMTAENQIHVANESGTFIDDEVTTGARYWYGLLAFAADGAQIAHGWHMADAVTDTEPPLTVEPLSARVSDGEILISWTRPDENYGLNSYRVVRSIDGSEPEIMATSYIPEQTSFVDNRPPESGVVTYSITASDFHWNTSAPANVTVELP